MKYVLTPDEMRRADLTATETYGIPSSILMENAAISSVRHLKRIFKVNRLGCPSIAIFCGCGNNGGDGFAMARHLHENYRIVVYWVGSQDKMSPETRSNYESTIKLGIEVIHLPDESVLELISNDFDCFVDAIIGIGGSENPHGIILPLLKKLNEFGGLKIAIDAPTGLNCATGIASKHAFVADYTITMFAPKTGLLINDGLDACDKILIAGIGAPKCELPAIASVKILEHDDVDSILPYRKIKSSKFDYGKVLVIAGSANYPGAAALAANAAIKAGAGLVYLASTNFHHSVLPEIIPIKLSPTNLGSIADCNLQLLLNASQNADSIVIGPGLGTDDETIKLVQQLIKEISPEKSLIIDADGLRAIENTTKLNKNTIITPHCGEFSRISGLLREEVETITNDVAIEWAEKLGCTILLKNVPTVITDGKNTFWNMTGNPGMASGGCGDVLSGIIAAFTAQGVESVKAAAVGAFIHGFAGDCFSNENSEFSLTASGIIDYLDIVFNSLGR